MGISDLENGLAGARGTLVVDASIVDFFREHKNFCAADSVFEVLSGHIKRTHFEAIWMWRQHGTLNNAAFWCWNSLKNRTLHRSNSSVSR